MAPAVQAAPTIYVVRRGWHVDVGFAAADLLAPLAGVAAEYPKVRFLVFGFGDKRYVLARHHGSGTLAAALWPGKGMMLVTGLGGTPAEAFGAANVQSLRLTDAEMRVVQAFVWSTFASTDGAAGPYSQGPYEGSLYFDSTARYSVLNTCNTWVADVLRAGGLHVRRTAVVLAGQVWNQVKRESRRQQSRGASEPVLDAPRN